LIQRVAGKVPILGVCLGHQAIAQAFGADIVLAPELMHGKTSEIRHDGNGIYAGIPETFIATRYHSLIVDPDTVPEEFRVTATSSDGVIQGIRHTSLPIEGVQYHPESILTVVGKDILRNFLKSCGTVMADAEPEPILGY
jgi:anthranilate synthase/aminodeoxychorismate synthase-like glutamine amidotransferase